jgi:hypothetical protein
MPHQAAFDGSPWRAIASASNNFIHVKTALSPSWLDHHAYMQAIETGK